MSPSRAQEIRDRWEAITDADDDISTERLLVQVADECHCDQDDVMAVIFTKECE